MKERSIQERKVPFSLRWGKTIPTRLAEDGCGKKDLFESWGYSIMDSENLTQEFMQQAKLAYMAGEYILGTLD